MRSFWEEWGFIWCSYKVRVILSRYGPNWVQPTLAKICGVATDGQTEDKHTDALFLSSTHGTHFLQRAHYKNGKATVSSIYITVLNITFIFCLYILSYYDMFRTYTTIIRYVWVLLKLFRCMLYFCHTSILDANFWSYYFNFFRINYKFCKSPLKYVR
jgi:hypothetical protein